MLYRPCPGWRSAPRSSRKHTQHHCKTTNHALQQHTLPDEGVVKGQACTISSTGIKSHISRLRPVTDRS